MLNSAGDWPSTSNESFSSPSISGLALSAFWIAALSLANTSAGVLAGMKTAKYSSDATSLKPLSANVGTLGRKRERLAPLTARMRSLPDWACGSTSGRTLIPAWIRPPSRSRTSGAPPLNGMWLSRRPAALPNIAPTKCGVAPADEP